MNPQARGTPRTFRLSSASTAWRTASGPTVGVPRAAKRLNKSRAKPVLAYSSECTPRGTACANGVFAVAFLRHLQNKPTAPALAAAYGGVRHHAFIVVVFRR